LTSRVITDLIVGALSTCNSQMLHQASRDEDMTNRVEEHPFERLKDYGKMRFESLNNLLLSLQEQSLF